MMISLDQAVSHLGTERRRIYDIINVLESLHMATKVNTLKECRTRRTLFGQRARIMKMCKSSEVVLKTSLVVTAHIFLSIALGEL